MRGRKAAPAPIPTVALKNARLERRLMKISVQPRKTSSLKSMQYLMNGRVHLGPIRVRINGFPMPRR